MSARPARDFWNIWNLCFGFFGIQFGLALQNSNLSRIFQSLGADVAAIPVLWIAAPMTGLLVQPVIGYYSDRTWNRFGRRRPYLLAGGIVAALALVAMPNAPTLFVAAGLLWILDGAINVAMGPIRALIGDALPHEQRARGYAMQTWFISVGSVIASVMPWCLAQCGVSNVAADGGVPQTVKLSFYLGAIAMAGALLWTTMTTREYAPDQLADFDGAHAKPPNRDVPSLALRRIGLLWMAVGVAIVGIALAVHADGEIVLLAAGVPMFGAAKWLTAHRRVPSLVAELVVDLHDMPPVMRRLAPVQLFSWFALFAMWTYTSPTVAQVYFAANDTNSSAWNEGSNWAGILFAAYNAVTAVVAMGLPRMTRRFGLRGSHAINLTLGGLGLLSFAVVRDPVWLLVSMIGVGFAWASILSIPYAFISDSAPASKMGAYMGIFNLFIVVPQIVAASFLGPVLRFYFHAHALDGLLIGGASLLVAAVLTIRIVDAEELTRRRS
ncbi:MAG: MFS transporter [Rudaea sp.]